MKPEQGFRHHITELPIYRRKPFVQGGLLGHRSLFCYRSRVDTRMIPQLQGTSNRDFHCLWLGTRYYELCGTEKLFMFHEVKIIDKQGKVKKVVSSKTLSKRYWEDIANANLKGIKIKGSKSKKPVKSANNTGLSYDDLYFDN
jgi:hypothetical protein